MKLILKNVRLVDEGRPDFLSEACDVFVRDGKFSESFDEIGAEIIDGQGHFLLPGVIDAHVHFREPGASHKENWLSASAAAAAGGVTSVLDMPNNNPPITTKKALELKRNLVRGRSHVDYGFHFGAIGNSSELEEVDGVCAFKIYMGNSTGEMLLDKPQIWEDVFEIAKKKNLPVIVHAENEARIRERTKAFHGDFSPNVHALIRDCECARIATEAALALREKIGNRLHIAHVSTAEEARLLQQYAHPDLSSEVTPHHLSFTMNDMKNDGLLVMNPPLREAEDVDALWELLKTGGSNVIGASDHAPHTLLEKSALQAPAGVPGVQFMLPIFLDAVKRGLLTYLDVRRVLCENPARIFSLDKKGSLDVGKDADMVLINLNSPREIKNKDVLSLCAWSPYEGKTFDAWPIMTFVRGKLVFDENGIVSEACGAPIFCD